MLTVPPEGELSGSQLFSDSGDPGLGYLDPLEPGPARGDHAARWLALDKGRLQLAAEVRFGYDEAAAQALSRLRPGLRWTAMPWQVAPVFAFAPVNGQARPVARGQTSGFGAHNAVLSAVVPSPVAAAPLLIAAELSCPALLVGARLAGEARTKELPSLLQQMALGPHAPADARLADVLLALLRGLLKQGALALRLEGSLSLGAPAALREAALLHWARLIADGWLGGASLAGPAQAARLTDGAANLDFDWQPGTTIPWRAIRRLTVQPPADVTVDDNPRPGGQTTIRAEGAWEQFDFVTVSLGGREVTLTAAAPEATAPAAAEPPRAVGALRGYGVSLALPVQRQDATLRVTLPQLVETARLVRADRELVAQVGPLDVALDHPGLAVPLMPHGGVVRLDAAGEERPHVSGVYRALLRRSEAAAPYQVTVTPAHGAAVSWLADGRGERLDIGPDRLAVLHVAAAPPGRPVAIEAAQGEATARQGLGQRKADDGAPLHWAYAPGSPLWLRASQDDYTTAWHEVGRDDPVTAPRVSSQQIELHGADVPLEIEVKSAAGEGRADRLTTQPGQTTTVAIPQDGDSENFLVRYRRAAAAAWSDWRPASGHELRLQALIE